MGMICAQVVKKIALKQPQNDVKKLFLVKTWTKMDFFNFFERT